MSVIKSYKLTTIEQCLTSNTFIKNLQPNEKLYAVNLIPNGHEVLVETEKKPETKIIITTRNYNIIKRYDALTNGLGGSMYST